MTSSLTSRLATAGVLIATLALPAAATAQYQLPTLTSSARADSLHEASVRIAADHRWGDAARLHRESAALRDVDDPLGYRCLSEAAALTYASGDRTGARKTPARKSQAWKSQGRKSRRTTCPAASASRPSLISLSGRVSVCSSSTGSLPSRQYPRYFGMSRAGTASPM